MVKQGKLPERFAERVLELELLMDQQKERTSVVRIRELLSIYADAIEYYGSMDMDKYLDLNARMQNTLVRPYVLAVLDREAEERKKEKKRKALLSGESIELKTIVSPRLDGAPEERKQSRDSEKQRLLSYDNLDDLAETAEHNCNPDSDGNNRINVPTRTHSSSTQVPILINGEPITPQSNDPSNTSLKIIEKIEKNHTNNIVAVKQDIKAQEDNLKERLKQRRLRKKFPLGQNSGSTTRSGYELTCSNYTSDSERSIDAYEKSFPATPTPNKKSQLSKNPQDCGNLCSPTGLRNNDIPVLPVEESMNMKEAKKEVWTLCYSNYATFREKLEQELEDFIEKSLQFKHDELEKVEKSYETQMKNSTEGEDAQATLEALKIKEMKLLAEKLDEERKRGIMKLKEKLNRSREEEVAKQREQIIQKFAVGDLPNF